ncbi:uncharacterized protein LOC131737003 [Acipenser ruthenus]|uniref:uncharacterized protein LOC131737003 n=1 Tax=Acipenser ruthenus TaxID=7906 RepID=UPI0027416F39|nr:uncharacterized protein LOC131737003 [Acipenser ruthenus]
MVRTVKMEQDCQVGKPMPAADPNLTSPDNHHDLTASAREEVESTKENEGDSTHMDQSNAQEKPVMKTKMEPSSTKLCGYLNKLGGPLKAWKARWFIFEEKKCQLYYYRTSQDVNPLGSIDLANATFGYPAQDQEETFQIQIPGRVVGWAVEMLVLFFRKDRGLPPSSKDPQGPSWRNRSTPSQRYISFPLYFAFRSQFVFPLPCPYRNTVLNICGNKPAQELRRSVFNFDKIQQSEDCPCEDPVTQILGETTGASFS